MIEQGANSQRSPNTLLDRPSDTAAVAADDTSVHFVTQPTSRRSTRAAGLRAWQSAVSASEHPHTASTAAASRDRASHRPSYAALLRQFGPSWFASAAVHGAMLVALGLMVVVAEPGNKIDGLLASFAEGASPTATDDLTTVEMTLPPGSPDADTVNGQLGSGPRSSRAGGPDVGGVLAGGEISRLKIEAREGGDFAIGSPAAAIGAAIGNGQHHGDIVNALPPGGGGKGEVVGKGYASFFGLEAKGYRFVYVVDGSGSMFGRRFAGARAELMSSLAALDEHQSFYVIFFNVTEYPQYYPRPERNLSPASPTTLEKVTRWMAEFVPNGDTNPVEAISRALALQPDAIFFLTDGEFSEAVMEKIQRENYRRIPIHTIAFESQLGERQLFGIAQLTGGTYRFVP